MQPTDKEEKASIIFSLNSSPILAQIVYILYSKLQKKFSDQHNYETSTSTQGNLIKRFYKTNRYRKYSITITAYKSWNKIQKQLKIWYLKIYPRIK